MSESYEELLPQIDPNTLSAGDVVEIANLIVAVRQYRTVEDCARDVVRAVQNLQRELAE